MLLLIVVAKAKFFNSGGGNETALLLDDFFPELLLSDLVAFLPFVVNKEATPPRPGGAGTIFPPSGEFSRLVLVSEFCDNLPLRCRGMADPVGGAAPSVAIAGADA